MATYSDSKSLVDQLGAENLTPELGGSLQYDHTSWVSNRLVGLGVTKLLDTDHMQFCILHAYQTQGVYISANYLKSCVYTRVITWVLLTSVPSSNPPMDVG